MTSIFAHRGYHHVYPENSVAAVASARELGADGVEIDVWLSADKYLMVNHDRTLNGLDISRTPRGELRADASLATLPEILEAAAGTRINVEIKATRSRAYNEAVARAVAQHLDASPASRQCLVSSFSLAVCDEVRRVSPQRPVGWLVTYRRADEVLDRVLEHRLTSAHFPFSRVSEAVARPGGAPGHRTARMDPQSRT